MSGIAYIVGAGPGDPGLITRRGLDVLRTCDVVLYDRLVPAVLIDEAPPNAERVFVGKSPGELHSRQIVADALLIERVREGKRVVRLKGGDPFVFGRGGEEAAILAEAGLSYEIVPGVSSAVAVPAYAGIPVTHRGVATSFTVLTAHEATDDPVSPGKPGAIADPGGTLVILMAVRGLRAITEQLIAGGRSPTQPAAVVEWGTTARQKTVVADLASIADKAEEERIKSPAIAIVGEVVALRDALNWFETRPLFGSRIVVTRPRSQAAGLTEKLASLGAEVLSLPTISIADPPSLEDLDLAIQKAIEGFYSWVVFTSVNGVEKFFERLGAASRDTRALARTHIAAVGNSTAAALRDRGVIPDLVPAEFSAAALAEALGRGTGHLLLPRVVGSPTEMVDVLKTNGWIVEEVAAYSNLPTRPPSAVLDEIRSGRFDVVAFTSGSTERNFTALVGTPEKLGLAPGEPAGKIVACIGPSTAAAAQEAGYRVDVVADEHTSDGLVAAILEAHRPGTIGR